MDRPYVQHWKDGNDKVPAEKMCQGSLDNAESTPSIRIHHPRFTTRRLFLEIQTARPAEALLNLRKTPLACMEMLFVPPVSTGHGEVWLEALSRDWVPSQFLVCQQLFIDQSVRNRLQALFGRIRKLLFQLRLELFFDFLMNQFLFSNQIIEDNGLGGGIDVACLVHLFADRVVLYSLVFQFLIPSNAALLIFFRKSCCRPIPIRPIFSDRMLVQASLIHRVEPLRGELTYRALAADLGNIPDKLSDLLLGSLILEILLWLVHQSSSHLQQSALQVFWLLLLRGQCRLIPTGLRGEGVRPDLPVDFFLESPGVLWHI
mmetsp:Transcript_15080/g.33216  ORF Transcript_15080/g.33216 Transcript_15080/m.33216 type:complete len:317 (-) Transcript_15080:234-1184(-)